MVDKPRKTREVTKLMDIQQLNRKLDNLNDRIYDIRETLEDLDLSRTRTEALYQMLYKIIDSQAVVQDQINETRGVSTMEKYVVSDHIGNYVAFTDNLAEAERIAQNGNDDLDALAGLGCSGSYAVGKLDESGKDYLF